MLTLALAAALAPPAAAASSPPRKHTKADMAAARSVLLRLADVGASWKTGRSKLGSLTCPSFQPTLKGVVETGAAASPNFRAGSAGPFVSQSAWVYRTAAQATTLWRAVVGKGLAGCFADSVRSGSTSSVTFAITGHRRLGLPKLRARAAGYRVVATAAATDQSITVVYDLIVLDRGRAVTELSFAGFSTPVPRALELRLARRTAARLARVS